MTPATKNGIVGATIGAFLGSVPGWLVARGLGAAIGAAAGAAALATVGVATASSSTPPAPTATPPAGGTGARTKQTAGLPRGQGMGLLPHLSPGRTGFGLPPAVMAYVRTEALRRGPGKHTIWLPSSVIQAAKGGPKPGPTPTPIMPCISCTVDSGGHIVCTACDVASSGGGGTQYQ